MGEQAAGYYSERTQRLDLGKVPAVLRGDPIDILDEDQVIPVHRPELMLRSPEVTTLYKSLKSVRGYLLRAAPDQTDTPKFESEAVENKNDRLMANFVGRLLIPGSIRTGKISGIRLEALAREETPHSLVTQIKRDSHSPAYRGDTEENSEAYFSVSGHLRTGARHTIVGGIILARAIYAYRTSHPGYDDPFRHVITVHYSGAKLNTTNKTGRQMHRESEVISEAIKEHNMRNSSISSVGTGKRRKHGR